MTNEDVIDLYNRVRLGTRVVFLARGLGDSPVSPRLAPCVLAVQKRGGVEN
jgi:hypothetical protein